MQFLVDMAYRLCGRSGVGFGGLAPLSDTVIESFARMHRITLEPEWVEALIHLDGAIREPDAVADEGEEPAPAATPQRAWPSRAKREGDED